MDIKLKKLTHIGKIVGAVMTEDYSDEQENIYIVFFEIQ